MPNARELGERYAGDDAAALPGASDAVAIAPPPEFNLADFAFPFMVRIYQPFFGHARTNLDYERIPRDAAECDCWKHTAPLCARCKLKAAV